jgi:SHAQKYF class myb-like DNA-binding protein
MFAVARINQNIPQNNKNEQKQTQTPTMPNTPSPNNRIKPRFLVLNDKRTSFSIPKQTEKHRRKIKFRLSTIKEDRNFANTNSHTPTSSHSENFWKRSKKQKEIKKLRRKRDSAFQCGRWQPDEHQRFIEAIVKYGNEWKLVQKHVGTRSSTQARSHAQKFFVKIKNSNLIKLDVDFSKNSIKSLHHLAACLDGEEYVNTIKALNCVAFERRSHSIRRRGRKDDLMSTSSFMNEFGSTMNTQTIGFR